MRSPYAMKLFDLAKPLQHAIEDNNKENLNLFMDVLDQTLLEAFGSLQQLLPETNEENPVLSAGTANERGVENTIEPEELQKITDITRSLSTLLQQNSVDADTDAKALSNMLRNTIYAAEAQKICSLVDIFSFVEALQVLHNLQQELPALSNKC